MTEAQRIIKYCAIAFAIFIIVSIVSGIMFFISTIGSVFYDSDNDSHKSLQTLETNQNINELDIDVQSVNLIIKEGTELKVETNNKHIKTRQDNQELKIKEKDHSLFHSKNNTELIIYLPQNKIFEEVKIDTGFGKVTIETLKTQKLKLDLGAGKTEINNIYVAKKTEIEGGVGEIIIENGIINNLDLDMGAGDVDVTAKLNGINKIDAGIGNIDLNLLGTTNDYQIKVDTGIGDVTLNDTKIVDGQYYGNGNNKVDIDGGAGNISINIK